MTPPRKDPYASLYKRAGAEKPVYRRSQPSPISAAIKAASAHPDDVRLAAFPKHPLPGGPDGQVLLHFTAPSKPLSVNATAGRSFRVSHEDKLAWLAAGLDAARAGEVTLTDFRGHRVQLTFALPLVNRSQADSGNYISGVSVKAAQDGITQSWCLVPNDTAEWVQTDVVFWAGGPTGDQVVVRVTAAAAPWHPDETPARSAA